MGEFATAMKFLAFFVLALLQAVWALDNGLALTPPMGWRSWNCFGGNVKQSQMEKIMEAMASRKRMVNGKPASLVDLGYNNIGLDDGWQNMSRCTADLHSGNFHDDEGRPQFNLTAFPDVKAMTNRAHALGLRAGWYMNNCLCKEKPWGDRVLKPPSWYEKVVTRSAIAAADLGFDGVKLDACSEYEDLHQWSAAFNATGRPILVENCHWGCTTPNYPKVKPAIHHLSNAECLLHVRPPWPIPPAYPTQHDGLCDGSEPVSSCPYNTYRTSMDIKANWGSVMQNLDSVVPFLESQPPVSRPGAWANPDNLEVGNLASFEESRSHFGAWCIVSAPLTLGFDISNETALNRVWDIISNTEAIAVNQAWEGHPGRRISNKAGRQVRTKPLSAGRVAVFLMSNGATNGTMAVDLTQLGFAVERRVAVRDVWARTDLPAAVGTFHSDSFGGHDSRFYVFGPDGSAASVVV